MSKGNPLRDCSSLQEDIVAKTLEEQAQLWQRQKEGAANFWRALDGMACAHLTHAKKETP